jgi:hypothetical protein
MLGSALNSRSEFAFLALHWYISLYSMTTRVTWVAMDEYGTINNFVIKTILVTSLFYSHSYSEITVTQITANNSPSKRYVVAGVYTKSVVSK